MPLASILQQWATTVHLQQCVVASAFGLRGFL
jgi:hypothetical protein